MKSPLFNGLLMAVAVAAAYWPMRAMPARPAAPPAIVALRFQPIELANIGPLHLAGAWKVKVSDPRFGGISSLTIDGGRFLAISDRGSVARFDMPGARRPQAWVAELLDGPGPWGRKWSRDAESMARDSVGRGWWVGYEQNHSLWLYRDGFERALATIDLNRPDWWNNRGAEGLTVAAGKLLVVAENGRDAMRIEPAGPKQLKLHSNSDVADAAQAPDGSAWVLLRRKSLRGISQSIGRLEPTPDGYSVRDLWPVPKGLFDNFEGMTIEARPDGRWRFWLVTDDGHRIMARTLLVALDLNLPFDHDKSPAHGTGLPKSQPSKSLRRPPTWPSWQSRA